MKVGEKRRKKFHNQILEKTVDAELICIKPGKYGNRPVFCTPL